MLDFIKKVIQSHGKHFLTFTFFAGFMIDWFALPSISNPLYPYIGIFYGSLVGLSILAKEHQLHLLSIGRGSRTLMGLATIVTSFTVGSLLSYVFIYYVRSGDMFTSWPLYLLLFACVFINEISFQTSTKLLINTGLLFIGIVFYAIFNTPLIYHEVSDAVFARSIIFGFLVCYLYSALLSLTIYNKRLTYKIYLLALITPVVISVFYFTNSIPAVPLTLRSEGLYSYVSKNSQGNYDFRELKKTPQTFLGFGQKEQIGVISGSPLYFYGAVIAPSQVNSNISHSWQRYDSIKKKWIVKKETSFRIVGGRKEGYRGYSTITYTEPGLWRVLVVVGEKRIVGQKIFTVYNL